MHEDVAWVQKRAMRWSPVIWSILEMSIRSTAVTGRNSTQACMIMLAEARGAGGSVVHKALHQKKDILQMRVDFLNDRASSAFQTKVRRVGWLQVCSSSAKMIWHGTPQAHLSTLTRHLGPAVTAVTM